MTVKELIDSNIFNTINIGEELEREISTPFCCDLLSIAMSSAPTDCAWVTVMGNINTLAVATLTDAACIVLAGNSALDESAIKKLKVQNITVFSTELLIFDAALKIYNLIHD